MSTTCPWCPPYSFVDFFPYSLTTLNLLRSQIRCKGTNKTSFILQVGNSFSSSEICGEQEMKGEFLGGWGAGRVAEWEGREASAALMWSWIPSPSLIGDDLGHYGWTRWPISSLPTLWFYDSLLFCHSSVQCQQNTCAIWDAACSTERHYTNTIFLKSFTTWYYLPCSTLRRTNLQIPLPLLLKV